MNVVFVFMLTTQFNKEAHYDMNQSILHAITLKTFNGTTPQFTTCIDTFIVIYNNY